MIRAKNMMSREVIAVSQNSSIMDAAQLSLSKSVSSLVVMEKEKIVAVLSERDIIAGVLLKKSKVKSKPKRMKF